MRHQILVGFLLVLVVSTVFVAVPAGGQSRTEATETSVLPRTPWGHPDLQGTWSNTTLTPLERPADLEGKQSLTDEELAVRQVGATLDVSTVPMPTGANPGSYNSFWLEPGVLGRQTSLIVDPPDGRMPPVTPAEEQRERERTDTWLDGAYDHVSIDSWLDLNTYDRCIGRGMPGLMLPGYYNHNYQILQTPDYIAIVVEMVHDARIIPLDGRPALSPPVPQWLGSSRGHWDGDTLVITTTTFSEAIHGSNVGNKATVFGGDGHHVVERFTRIDAATLDYRVTVTNPDVWTRPWTVSTPMQAIDETLFEYACHEGNYALPNILRANRADDEAASR